MNVYVDTAGNFYAADTPNNPNDHMKPVVSADFLAVLTAQPQKLEDLQTQMVANMNAPLPPAALDATIAAAVNAIVVTQLSPIQQQIATAQAAIATIDQAIPAPVSATLATPTN